MIKTKVLFLHLKLLLPVWGSESFNLIFRKLDKNKVTAFLIFFLLISFLLRIFGIIDYSLTVISGYVLIIYGFTRVYSAFGNQEKAALFGGTVLFLVGIILFLSGSVDFPTPARMVIPSFMFIMGTGFLILFIDDYYNIVLLIVSAAFLLLGISATILWGNINPASFIDNIGVVTIRYWPIVLIAAGIMLLFRKRK
jgi:hypothetical protein